MPAGRETPVSLLYYEHAEELAASTGDPRRVDVRAKPAAFTLAVNDIRRRTGEGSPRNTYSTWQTMCLGTKGTYTSVAFRIIKSVETVTKHQLLDKDCAGSGRAQQDLNECHTEHRAVLDEMQKKDVLARSAIWVRRPPFSGCLRRNCTDSTYFICYRAPSENT